MVCHIPIHLDAGNKAKEEYKLLLAQYSPLELLDEFIDYLDYTDETDSGRVFHPITIGSCRVMLSQALDILLKEMRKRT